MASIRGRSPWNFGGRGTLGRALKGSISELEPGKRYRVRVYLGSDPVSGAGRSESKVVRGTREQAERVRDRMVAARGSGGAGTGRAPAVRALVKSWLAEVGDARVRAGKLKLATFREYAALVSGALDLAPGFRDRRADTVRAPDVRAFYAAIQEQSPGGGATRVRHVHAVLRQVFRRAYADETVPRDPTLGVELPAPAERRPHRALSADQARKLIGELRKAGEAGLLLELALACGLRPSEAMGVRVDAVDLEARTLRVGARIRRVLGKLDVDAPKSERSKRLLAIPASLVPRLAEQRRRVAERRLKAKTWQDHGLLFPAKRGEPRTPKNLAVRVLHPACARAGVPRMTLHGLRHSQASLLTFEHGLPVEVVAGTLGHADPALTARVYAKPRPAEIAAADAMDELLRSVTRAQ